jgi:hypothetical protein
MTTPDPTSDDQSDSDDNLEIPPVAPAYSTPPPNKPAAEDN